MGFFGADFLYFKNLHVMTGILTLEDFEIQRILFMYMKNLFNLYLRKLFYNELTFLISLCFEAIHFLICAQFLSAHRKMKISFTRSFLA